MSLLPRKSRFSAKVSGAGSQAQRARDVANMIERDQSARNVADDAELIYQEHAPRRSNRLARGIRAVTSGDDVIVTATAVDPQTGFDYVAVTRFGHRKRVIIPVTKGGQARQSRTVRRTKIGTFTTRGRGALVFESRGQVWKLPSVRGFRPKGDWVERARPEIDAAAATEMEQTGNKIATRWSS